jgi:hypothetical protein
MFDDREFVDLDECARRMNLTKAQVLELVHIRALRSVAVVDEIWVEPAIVNSTP